jgi:hypothetical protein
MRCPAKREVTEIRKRLARTAFIDLANAEQTAQCGYHLKID